MNRFEDIRKKSTSPPSRILFTAVLLALPRIAAAQCAGPTSSCHSCHETEGRARPEANEPWHADHAFGDFCADCHGGDRTAVDAAIAHMGVADPLTREPTPCAPCHATASALVDRYKGWKGATAPVVRHDEPPRDIAPTSRAAPRSKPALVLLAFMVLAGATYVVGNERRRRGGLGQSFPKPSSVEWSPYVAGALLGLVAALSMAFFGHRLSGGGAYQQIAAPLGRLVSPASVYWTRILGGVARWELAALAGAVLGAFAAARTSGAFRVRTMPDSQWTEAFGASVAKRWVIAFFGAALTEFASGIAGGCTASLAVSGGAALAPGAFAFMTGMFVGGIPTAWWVYRKVAS